MITPIEVKRDEYGYWTHPEYVIACDGREYISTAEIDKWMEKNGLEWRVEYRDEEDIDPDVDGYDISAWQPSGIKGDGWFVGSIHNTDDGAVCIWLRTKQGGDHE